MEAKKERFPEEFYDDKFHLITILKPSFTSNRNILSNKRKVKRFVRPRFANNFVTTLPTTTKNNFIRIILYTYIARK